MSCHSPAGRPAVSRPDGLVILPAEGRAGKGTGQGEHRRRAVIPDTRLGGAAHRIRRREARGRVCRREGRTARRLLLRRAFPNPYLPEAPP
jgi:hypothetical protein